MKAYRALLKGLVLSATLAAAPPIFGAVSYAQVAEVFPSDPAAGQFFGFATAISDDVAVVGASSNPSPFFPGNPSDGAAYVFVRTDAGWVFQQKLVASDSTVGNTTSGGNQFGLAVEVAGDTIVVGAPNRRAGDKVGAVYVFTRSDSQTSWTEQAIITSSAPRPFGHSLALRGGTLVVGGLEDRLSGGGTSDAGLAFVFVRSGDAWIEQGNLMSSDVPPRARFGVSVGIRGNTVVVGAQDFFVDTPAAVYVFSRQGTTWTEQAKISPTNNSRSFGQSVSLWGASLAVGDPGSSTVSIYEHNGHDWQLLQTLVDNSGTSFGYSVAQRENSLFIGARTATFGVRSGVAYLYGFDEESWTWTLRQTLAPTDGQTSDIYGTAVSLSSTAAIIGAPRHFHSPSPQSGAAYIYEP